LKQHYKAPLGQIILISSQPVFSQVLYCWVLGAEATNVVIVWRLDLQLPMQSVPITTTNVVSSNPVHI